MIRTKNYNESGGVVLNVMLATMLALIGVLVYMLVQDKKIESIHSVGLQSPAVVIDDAPTPATVPMDTEPRSHEPIHEEPQVEFTDGLTNPVTTEKFSTTEFGEGLSQRDVFTPDINKDGRRDRITRIHNENGTGHDYDEYKIELNINGKYKTITPNDMRTVVGAECALTKFQFVFEPQFRVIKISRPWQDSWDTPTVATKTIYVLNGKKMHEISSEELGTMCDVSAAF